MQIKEIKFNVLYIFVNMYSISAGNSNPLYKVGIFLPKEQMRIFFIIIDQKLTHKIF